MYMLIEMVNWVIMTSRKFTTVLKVQALKLTYARQGWIQDLSERGPRIISTKMFKLGTKKRAIGNFFLT